MLLKLATALISWIFHPLQLLSVCFSILLKPLPSSLPTTLYRSQNHRMVGTGRNFKRSSHSRPLPWAGMLWMLRSLPQNPRTTLLLWNKGCSCGMWLVLAGAGTLFSWQLCLGAELYMCNCRAVSMMIKIATCRVLSQPLLQQSPSQTLHMGSPGQPSMRRTPPATRGTSLLPQFHHCFSIQS